MMFSAFSKRTGTRPLAAVSLLSFLGGDAHPVDGHSSFPFFLFFPQPPVPFADRDLLSFFPSAGARWIPNRHTGVRDVIWLSPTSFFSGRQDHAPSTPADVRMASYWITPPPFGKTLHKGFPFFPPVPGHALPVRQFSPLPPFPPNAKDKSISLPHQRPPTTQNTGQLSALPFFPFLTTLSNSPSFLRRALFPPC